MAVAFVKQHGTGGLGAQSKTAGTTLTVTNLGVAAGSLLVAFIASDNTSAVLPTLSSITKPAGETATWSISSGASTSSTAAGGVRLNVAYIKTTVAWPAGGTDFLFTLSNSVTAKAALVAEFSGVSTFVSLATSGNSSTGTPTATLASGNTRVGGLIVGCSAFESALAATDDVDTTLGTWSTGASVATSGSTDATNVRAHMQYKITTAAGIQNLNASGASADANSMLLSFDVAAPSTFAVSGTVTSTSTVSGTAVGPPQKILHLDAGNPASYNPAASSTWTDLTSSPSSYVMTGVYDTDGGGSIDFSPGPRFAQSGGDTKLDVTYPFSIDFWIKPDALTGTGLIFGRDIGVDGYGVKWVSGSFVAYMNGAGQITVPGTAGVWQHIAMTFDPVQQTVYFNGTLDSTEPPAFPSGSSGGTVTTYISQAPENLNAKLAILRIWDQPLTSTQVGSLYAAESARFAGGGGTTYAASGTVTSTSAVTGAVTSKLASAGAVTATSTAAGAVTSVLPTAGTNAAASTVSGAVTAKLPSTGTVTAVSTVSGAATIAAVQYPASGTVTATSAVSGAVISKLPTAGTSAATSTVSGAVTSRLPATGVVTSTSTSSGAVTSLLPAAGGVTAASAVAGTVTELLVASGTVTNVSTVSGSAALQTAAQSAAGTVTSTSTVSGSVTVQTAAAGTVAITSGVTGAVTSRLPSTGVIPATSTTTGAAAARLVAAGIVTSVSTASGTVVLRAVASGTVVATSTVTGSSVPVGGSDGTVVITSTVSGSVGLRAGVTGVVTATSGITGSTSVLKPTSGTVTATSATSGAVAARLVALGVVPATSTSTGAVQLRAATSGTITITSTVSGNTATRFAVDGIVGVVSDVSGDAGIIGPSVIDPPTNPTLVGAAIRATLTGAASSHTLVGSIAPHTLNGLNTVHTLTGSS